jgi:hypothetical protein
MKVKEKPQLTSSVANTDHPSFIPWITPRGYANIKHVGAKKLSKIVSAAQNNQGHALFGQSGNDCFASRFKHCSVNSIPFPPLNRPGFLERLCVFQGQHLPDFVRAEKPARYPYS